MTKILLSLALALTAAASNSLAMDGYIVCGSCKYFDPATRSCNEAPGCGQMTDGYGYDCGHCAAWYADNERGHCETIVGCGGADSASWPQVLYGENQSQVAR